MLTSNGKVTVGAPDPKAKAFEDCVSADVFSTPERGELDPVKGELKVLLVDGTVSYGGAFEIAYNIVKYANQVNPRSVGLVAAQPPDYLRARVAGAFPWCYFPKNRWKDPQGGRIWLPFYTARNLLWSELPATYHLSSLIREFGATVVHLNNTIGVQMHGAVASRLTGARCVCSHRDYAYPSRLLQPIKGFVDRHIVCSKTVKSHLVNVLGIPEAKIAYIYDPVDTDAFSPAVPPADLESRFGVPRGRKVFTIIGRLVPWKGHKVFLRAASLVLEAVPDAHALVVGDTADGDQAYDEELRTMCRELAIADRTTFTGYRSDIAPLMRASDVLVHASTMAEPFGTVVLEGMACGRPYVAMDEGGPPEMIDSGIHGILVRPSEPGLMAQAIIDLLTDPEMAAACGAAARRRSVERFSAPAIARQHLELYREVMEQRS
ncbi:MAG: glycosyltransferase family 4 protein [Isosphaeraceae bacterium]|jgi:glycosyltransferase involved in cell wall biosynthesis